MAFGSGGFGSGRETKRDFATSSGLSWAPLTNTVTQNGIKVKKFIFIASRCTAGILPAPKISFLSVKTSVADLQDPNVLGLP